MPSTRYVVLERHIYSPWDIYKFFVIFMWDKIALADTKLRAHQPVHLFGSHGIFTDKTITFFRSSRKCYWQCAITIFFDEVDHRYTKTGASTDRGNNLLKYFIEAQFCAQDIAESN